MMSYSDPQIWTIIAIMGIGTYLIRFSFLGLLGDRKMPDWVLRHLRYTPVAVLPGIVAPLVMWPNGGDPDPVWLIAASVTLFVAWWRKDLLSGAFAGTIIFGILSWVAG